MQKLDAINTMLRAIGQAPVTSTSIQHPHVIMALSTLDSLDLEIQGKGWWFNEEKNILLSPDETNQIILPSNVLNADPTQLNWPTQVASNYVQRGSKLYDIVNHTFVIPEPVRVNLRFLLPFEELPETAAAYIAAAAAYEFHSDVIGDQQKMPRLQARRDTLQIQLNGQNINNRNINAHTSPGVSRMMSRVRPANS